MYSDCDREIEKLVRISFVTVEGESWDENEPKIWQLDFPTPVALTSVEAGRLPDGAVEAIPWRQPGPDQVVSVDIAYEERPHATVQDFTLRQLDDGKTLHRHEWITAEEFDERCD
ncbi:hypothetical protein C8D87_106260 [Lentzea atacamensis]|uniref:Uncharacterized protein n=1 Tax=Lentzea atacamensis TaxID=531938 RepID=A0ABX9E7I8_9PSEU|nr:hypothetical protein [Lentzea atacamensis]RAS63858.1 hypothetical protein C8D87_106260 [Lentzea atacamensis]